MSQLPPLGGPGQFVQGNPGQQQPQGQQVDLAQLLTSLNKRINDLTVGLTNLRRRVWAGSVRTALQDAGREPRMPIQFRSAIGEDILLWELFGGQLDGLYVEVGAGDGLAGSLSFVFDCVGWDGVLVEADPDRAAQAREHRPNARTEPVAVSRASKAGKGTLHVPEQMPIFSYISAAKSMTDRLAAATTINTVEVDVKTLDEVLGDLDKRIDLLAIDVTGGEVDVLAGFDRDKHKPRVICVDAQVEPAGGQKVDAFMQGTGYKLVNRYAGNLFYVHEDEEEIIARAGQIMI